MRTLPFRPGPIPLPRIPVLVALLAVTAAAPAQTTSGAPSPTRVLELSRGTRTLGQVEDRRIVLRDSARLVVRSAREPVVDGRIACEGDGTQVLFTALGPAAVHADVLRFVWIDGEPADLTTNTRLVPLEGGASTLLLPHGPDHAPLTVYPRTRMRGDGRRLELFTYHRSEQLGDLDDRIASFELEAWSMATFAENEDGSGASHVFVARDEPLAVRRLPEDLRDAVSFVRVFRWRDPIKKGFGGSLEAARRLDAGWRYDWGAGGESTLEVEYVPMRHNRNWDSFDKINRKRDVTHLLGFNEPMQKDQANMSMQECLDLWPRLQESGLRLGSPCPTDGSVDWLVRFVDEADARGLRVDFVAVHYYKGGWSDRKMISWLETIHERTGRPLWVTEWNDGASWVRGHDPSPEDHAERIAELSRALDACPFVERYAVFDLGDRRHHRQIFLDGELTPAGRAYRDNPSASSAVPAGRPR